MLIKIKSDTDKEREKRLLKDFRKTENKENLELVETISKRMKEVDKKINKYC